MRVKLYRIGVINIYVLLVSACLFSPLCAKDKTYELKDTRSEFGRRKILMEKYPHLKVLYLYLDTQEDIGFGVFSDDNKKQIFLLCMGREYKVSTVGKGDEIELSKEGGMFFPEKVKAYGYIVTDSGKEIDKDNVMSETIGSWMKYPTDRNKKIKFTYIGGKPVEFILTLKTNGQCNVLKTERD